MLRMTRTERRRRSRTKKRRMHAREKSNSSVKSARDRESKRKLSVMQERRPSRTTRRMSRRQSAKPKRTRDAREEKLARMAIRIAKRTELSAVPGESKGERTDRPEESRGSLRKPSTPRDLQCPTSSTSSFSRLRHPRMLMIKPIMTSTRETSLLAAATPLALAIALTSDSMKLLLRKPPPQ